MKYDKDSEISYTLGTFPTYELVKNKPNAVTKIYLHEKLQISEDIEKLLELARKNNIIVEKNTKIIERISSKENVYIMGEFKKYNTELDFNQNQIVLYSPSDMGNVGTILRTALGFGVKNIIFIKPCVDYFNPKVVRGSMGAIFSLNLKSYENFDEYLNDNKDIQKYMFMLDGEENLQNLSQIKKPFALIFGNEATGLPQNVKQYGKTVLIKHFKTIDSLNLSISIGISIYEFTKENFNK